MPSEGFKIASAFVTVDPDTEGFREKLQAALDEATKGTEGKVRVGIDDGELRAKLDDIKARLDELDGYTVAPRVSLNSDELRAKLDDVKARLDDLDGYTIAPRVSLDIAEFTAKYEEVKAKLDELEARRVSISIGANDSQVKSAAADSQSAITGLQSFALGHPIILSAILGGSALLPGLAGATAGLGLLAGTGALAFGGIIRAISAHSQAMQQQAQNQPGYAMQIQSAQLSLAEAIRNAAMSQAQAIQGVTQAQQQEQTATVGLASAQYNLRDAWIQARYSLQQLNDQLHNNATNIQAAKLAVQQAEYQQKLVDQNAMSTALQRAQAAIAVKQAQEQLTATQQQATYTAKEAHLQDQAGVSGSQQVIQAQQAVRQAIYALRDARVQSAMAQKNLTNTELNNAAQVKQAELAVAQAQMQAGAGMALFGQDMAKLSGPAQAIVNLLLKMHPAFLLLQHIAQNAIAPGILAFLHGIQSNLPVIDRAVRSMGQAISQAFGQFGRLMQTSAFKEGLAGLLRNGIEFTKIVLPAFAQFFQLLGKVGGMKGAVGGISGLLAGLANALSGLLRGLAPSLKPISAFFTELGTALADIGKPLGQVIGALANVLAPVLKALLPGWKSLLDALGKGLAQALNGLIPVLVPVATDISNIVIAFAPLLPIIGQWIGLMAGQLAPILQAVTPLFHQMAQTIPEVLAAIQPLLPIVPQLITLFVKLITVPLLSWIVKVADTLISLQGTVAQVLGAMTTTIGNWWTHTYNAFQTGVDGLKTVWDTLTGIFKAPVSFLVNTVYDKGIARVWNDVAGAIGLSGLKLPLVSFAGGGIVPGRDRGRDETLVAMRPQEGVLVPGAASFLGHDTIHALNKAFGGGGRNEPGHFQQGGILGGIWGGLKHLLGAGLHDLSSLLGDIGIHPEAVLNKLLSSLIKTPAKGDLGQLMLGIPKAIIGELAKAITQSGGGTGPSGPLPGGSTGAVGMLPANWKTIATYLAGHGFTKFAAAGVSGNIFAESGGNPEILEIGGGGGGGLIQWTPYPPGYITGNYTHDLFTQLAAILTWGGGPGLVNRATSPSNAALLYQDYYERPASLTATIGTRMASANAVYQAMGWGKFDDGGWLMPGMAPMNRTGRPEAVLSPEESRAFVDIVKQLTAQGVGRGISGPVFNYFGTQHPTPEQKANMMRDLSLATSGAAG